MRRTLMERIRHEVAPAARPLRRDPVFSEMELMSCGSIRVNIANPRFAQGYEALAVKTELGRQYGSVSATFSGADADKVREILREADRLTIKTVSAGACKSAPLDHGRFGGTLSTGQVVIRVPTGAKTLLDAFGKSEADVRGGVLFLSPEEGRTIPREVDEVNLQDMAPATKEVSQDETFCPTS